MLIFLIVLIAVFIFYPVKGNPINIVAGSVRIVYTLICFGITFCFLKADMSFIPAFIRKSLAWLGAISYSLYLLHAHVWALITYTSLKIRFVYPIACVATLVVCWLVFKYLETPARDLGARLAKKKNLKLINY